MNNVIPMPSPKENIRRKYGITAEDFDVAEVLALRSTCELANGLTRRLLTTIAIGALALAPALAHAATAGSFTLVGSTKQFRRAHTATLLFGGKVLVAGGFNTSDTGPSTELFDPVSAVATPFLLTQPMKLPTGAFQFTFRSTPGLSFTVLSTTDLAVCLNDWASLGVAAEISPGQYQLTDLQAAQNPQRFYRVRSP
ncbi:MAG TPA: hypothetical protein VJA21_19915 [Verrucomicrobiae bacterium]